MEEGLQDKGKECTGGVVLAVEILAGAQLCDFPQESGIRLALDSGIRAGERRNVSQVTELGSLKVTGEGF